MTAKTGNPVGRPKKAAKKSVGRPIGEAGIMKEYRQRMLNSPKSPKVLDAIFKAALDDEHKNQATAWKLIIDRIAPLSGFETEGKSKAAGIEITIKGLAAEAKTVETVDAEFSEVE